MLFPLVAEKIKHEIVSFMTLHLNIYGKSALKKFKIVLTTSFDIDCGGFGTLIEYKHTIEKSVPNAGSPEPPHYTNSAGAGGGRRAWGGQRLRG